MEKLSKANPALINAAILLTEQLYSLDDTDCFWTDETLVSELIAKVDSSNVKHIDAASTDNYPAEIIESAKKTYEHILEQLCEAQDGLTIGQLSFCSENQKDEAVKLGKGKNIEYDNAKTVVDLFREQAQRTPTGTAIVAGSATLTYGELDDLTDRVALYLREKGVGREDVVSIIIPRTEMMAVCSIGALKAGATYQPLDPSYPTERLNFMMKDAGAGFLIADRDLRPLVNEYDGEVLFTDEIKSLQAVKAADAKILKAAAPSPSDRHILLYTSGSTGVPKGCELCHSNLVAFIVAIQDIMHFDETSRVTAYASYGFDANMMDMYPALTHGSTLHVIKEDIRFDLDALNDYFEKVGMTHAFMTTQVARAYATGVKAPASLKHLYCGGEALVPLDAPETYTMHNVYGPTETTVFVTQKIVDKLYHRIPIGGAVANCQISIVDKNMKILPVGVLGELVITGPQVSRGYLNRPEKTAEVFVSPKDGGWKTYRTGDVARMLPNGDIDFIGRRDGQVKIRGFRVELSEIEQIIREYEGIRDATVQAFDDPAGGKFIAAYIVSDNQIDIAALNAFIGSEKPSYMIPAVTMQIESIPLNQNQKVDKKKLPTPEFKAEAEDETDNRPLNRIEQDIKDCIANLIGNSGFGIATPLKYLGLTSISSIRLASEIFKRFNVKFTGKELLADGTIGFIADRIIEERIYSKVEIKEKARVKTDSCPLSSSQFGVYIDSINNPTAIIYNTPFLMSFSRSVTEDRLENAVKEVFAAHEYVQCHFEMRDGEAVQVAGDSETIVAHYQVKENEIDALCTSLILPFSVQNDKKLYRIAIITTPESTCLFLDMHHLIVDGTSANILIRELIEALNGNPVEKEAYTYFDYCLDEKEYLASEACAKDKEYFDNMFANADEGSVDIPYSLNGTDAHLAKQVIARFDFKALEAKAKAENGTPASLCLAAVAKVAAAYSGMEQVLFSVVTTGRGNVQTGGTVGMMVKSMPALLKPHTDIAQLIQDATTVMQETLDHDSYPLAQIVEDYGFKPRFMYAYQLGLIENMNVDGSAVKFREIEQRFPKVEIMLLIEDDEDGAYVKMEYDSALYTEEFMQAFAEVVAATIDALSSGTLKDSLPIPENQLKALDSFNFEAEYEYDSKENVVEMFLKAAKQYPENKAVVCGEESLLYSELDDISDRVATYLSSRGIGKGDVVAIIVERNPYMAIAALGVLKSGAAYQPLDFTYPADRLQFMVQDAGAKLLIGDEDLVGLVAGFSGDILLTKDISSLAKGECKVSISPEDALCILYTSGSTGTPKGAVIEHKNIRAFVAWYHRNLGLKAGDVVAAYASYGFDAHMMDLYSPLTTGATMCIVPSSIRLNLDQINDYYRDNCVTHIFMTTQLARMYATTLTPPASLRYLMLGGETLVPLDAPEGYSLMNVYGPTECTIFTTTFPLDQNNRRARIPVGKALDNFHLYVVGTDGCRVPIGALGELWASGPQVSRGYLNRPEKTAETYLKNPFDHDKDHAVIYRTGDIVRMLPDGNVDFIGRRDGQVKIRGFRIELSEVEGIIRQYPGIKDATVQAFDDPAGGKFITAYVVSDSVVDESALAAFIKQTKPPYMVPAVVMQIDAIPLNQNQKVNKRALPQPEKKARTDGQSAKNETEKTLCQIFGEILKIDNFFANDSFFDMGGTSLSATRVVLEAKKKGLQFTYSDVFDNPTPQKLAALISGEDTGVFNPQKDIDEYDYTAINNLLANNTLETFLNGERRPLGNVALFGATGFLGIHVLNQLLENYQAKVYAVVRQSGGLSAEKYLSNLYYYYFGETFADYGERIVIVEGSLTDSDCFARLAQEPVDTVINCAANVKHFSKGTDIEDVNYYGFLNIIDFCKKTGACLVQTSTMSIGGTVCGNDFPIKTLGEHSLYLGQDCSGSKYIWSKFLAERAALQAATEGLNVKIMRLGNLAPREVDGEFQINAKTNSFMRDFRAYGIAGAYPYDADTNVFHCAPIDSTAEALLLLAQTPQGCVLFHDYNNHNILFGDIIEQMQRMGIPVRGVEPAEYHQIIDKIIEEDPSLASIFGNDIAYNMHSKYDNPVEPNWDNLQTHAILLRMGFRWPETYGTYMHKFLAGLENLGFFDR